MLQHEGLVVFYWETVLLLAELCVLFQLELELIDEHFCLLLVCLYRFLLVALFYDALQKLVLLEFYWWLYAE